MKYAFAHRGGRGHGLDNTIPTFRRALADGATGLETDAWVTADGIVVLDHDGLHRPGGPQERPIGATARAELAGHIPTLAELYDACGTDFDLAVDVKGPGTAEAINTVAEGYRAADRLWLFTPGTEHGRVGTSHAGASVRGEDLQRRAGRRAMLRRLADAGVEVVNARWPWWRRAAVADVHALGMLAFAWDVQWSVALWRCRRLGIDGVFSDHVRLLRKA